jgi:hypothetical protein
VVYVYDPEARRGLLGDLMRTARARNAGADVKELTDPGFGTQVADRAPQEGPVGAGSQRGKRVLHPWRDHRVDGA